MRSVLIIASLAFIVPIILLSCGDHPCIKASMNYRLIGFSDAEADTIILRRMPKASLSVRDSQIFDPANPIRFVRFGDTLVMTSYTGNAELNPDHDYQFYFPGAAKTIHVTEIREKLSSSSYRKTHCMNEVISCKVNGAPAKFFFINGIYLEK